MDLGIRQIIKVRRNYMEKEITTTQYRTLEGIRALSSQLNKDLERLVIATSDISGEELDEQNYGHTSDFIFGDMTVKEYLRKIKVSINKKKF